MADIKQSFNQVDIEREDEFIHTILRFYKIQQNICLPAIVRKVYPEKHTVDAELLCSYVTTDGKEIKRALLSEIPWKQMRHGGFFIDFPISVGDTGWVIAGDRDSEKIRESNSDTDISKNKGSAMPETNGIDEFQYGVFIPDSWAKPNEKAKDSLVIGTRDNNGNVNGYISLDKNGGFEVDNDNGHIELSSDGSIILSNKNCVIKVSADGNCIVSNENGKIELTPDGKFKASNNHGYIELTKDGTFRINKNDKTIEIDPTKVLTKLIANLRYDSSTNQLQWDEFTIRGIDYKKTGSMNVELPKTK